MTQCHVKMLETVRHMSRWGEDDLVNPMVVMEINIECDHDCVNDRMVDHFFHRWRRMKSKVKEKK